MKTPRPSTSHFSFGDTPDSSSRRARNWKILPLVVAVVILIFVIVMGAWIFSHQYTEYEMKRILDVEQR